MKLRHHFATIPLALIVSGCASEASAPEMEDDSSVQPAEVDDTRAAPSLAGATIAVTTTNDAGAGSLRDALTRANAAAGADTIEIQVAGTITVSSPLPYVTGEVSIVGPGADKVTIKAAAQTNFGIFGTDAAFGISGVTLSGGRRSDTFGGAINGSPRAPLTIADTVFSDNEAMIGAAINSNAPTTIVRSRFLNHKGGSVIAIGDTATLTDTVVANNASAAILFTSLKNLTVERCTISGNASPSLAGAVHQRHGHVDVINSTLSGNSGRYAGDFWVEEGSLALLNVTAADGAAPAMKRDATSTITARNSIFAGTGNRCMDSTTITTSEGGNLSTDSTCGLSDPTDKSNASPRLGALANNGGLTQTRALLEGSPAINAGVGGNLPTTDQRGKPRTISGKVDMGAYEFEPSGQPAPIVVTTTNDTGPGSLRDALTRANAAAGADTIEIRVVGTIPVNSPLPYVTGEVAIVGPGADKVTIKAAAQTNFGIFGTDAAFGISGVTLSGGRRSDTFGGAINGSPRAPLTIADTVFSGNEAMIGAAINSNAPTTIVRSRFLNHKGGSVIAIGDTATLTDTVVANNASAAILFTSLKNLTVERCTISGNASPSLAGAVHQRHGHVDVINSTLSGNSGRYAGDFWVEEGSLALLNVTAADGAAPALKRDATSTITARNSIFAGTGSRCMDSTTITTSQGGNLSTDSTCGLSDPTDKSNTSPRLGALANNGGLTQTRALLEGSPAINAGVGGNLPTTDQRGKPRTISGKVDMGAYEFER